MNAERVGSLFWLALGLISIYGSFRLGLGTLSEPGSGFLSLLAGSFISLIALLILLQTFLRGGEAPKKLATLWAGVNWHRSLTIGILVLGFILVLERGGFFLTSFALLFILLRWVEKFSWKMSIMIPGLTLGITYLLFNILLKATLPRGILGF